MPELPKALTAKYGGLPGWAWVSVVGVGGAAVWLVARRRAAVGSSAVLSPTGAGVRSTGGYTSTGGGGGGGYPSGSGGGDSSVTPLPPVWHNLPTDPASKVPPAPAPAKAPSPSAAQLPDLVPAPVATIIAKGNVSNPVGSALADAANPANRYTPSALDFATERPGGLDFTLAGPVSGPSNAYSTIYTNFTGGTGPVVAPENRIAGERYDAAGRVIL